MYRIMPVNRRSVLKTVTTTAIGLSVLGSTNASASDCDNYGYRTIIVGGSDSSREIDFTVGIDSYDVTACNPDSTTSVSNDYNHDTTNIRGTVRDESERFELPNDARIMYLEASGEANKFCDDFDRGCGPSLAVSASSSGTSHIDTQLEVSDPYTRNYDDMRYEVNVHGSIYPDGGLEGDDNDEYDPYNDRATGTVGLGDVDYYEMTSNYDYVELFPLNSEIYLDRQRLS